MSLKPGVKFETIVVANAIRCWWTKDHLEEGDERLARRNRRLGVFHGRGAFSRAQSRGDRFENNARRRRWSSSFLSLEGPRHLCGMPPRQGPPFPRFAPEAGRERERGKGEADTRPWNIDEGSVNQWSRSKYRKFCERVFTLLRPESQQRIISIQPFFISRILSLWFK